MIRSRLLKKVSDPLEGVKNKAKTRHSERVRHLFQQPASRNAGAVLLIAAGFAMASTGCGYVVGSAYQTEVRTIEVPVFTSDGYRRGVEFQLTEAVQKEITKRTPFRIVKGPAADTRLTGHIVQIHKYVLGGTGNDDARELQVTYDVDVSWEDVRTGRILAQQRVPLTPDLVRFRSQASFAPEIGQSLATANQAAFERLARQIVNMMETPW